jgi:hypothetical protein
MFGSVHGRAHRNLCIQGSLPVGDSRFRV